jgi:hypothetical protein
VRRFNLRRDEDEQWLVVDGLTMQPATLDDLPVVGLCWAEACEFVDLLNSMEIIERAAGRYGRAVLSQRHQ